ncbi:MAG: metallophosphoesterase family protein [Deltaproteobacteria bacterium]|nr:metallophosphoesterase family protein [Deltaproteobacteria bacterium]
MRIYAVADIHGRSDKIALIRGNTLQLNPDVLVVAGDITSYTGSAEILAQLNDIPVPVLAVRGNSDLSRVEKLLETFTNISPLHLKQVTIDGTPFIGVSGCVPIPFSSRICLNEMQVIEKLKPLIKSNSVLVAHPPPWGTLDKVFGRFHAGCRSLTKVIKMCQPMLMICGHIHERPGSVFIGKTLVINCALGRNHAGAVIELDNKNNLKAEML